MTTPSDTLIQRIQTAVADSPELQQQLTAVKSTEEAAALLTRAMGSPIAAADLQSLGASIQSQMTDAQLEAVAAGLKNSTTWILFSVFTVGVACAATSIDLAAHKSPEACKSLFTSPV